MKWVTRANVKVDRVACPWLIRTFVDRDAEFLFVPVGEVESVARNSGAISRRNRAASRRSRKVSSGLLRHRATTITKRSAASGISMTRFISIAAAMPRGCGEIDAAAVAPGVCRAYYARQWHTAS